MESLLDIVEQGQTLIRIIIVILIIGIIMFTIKIMRRAYKPNYDASRMPANLWFYSKLINLEVGNDKANYKNLHNSFMTFLMMKYRIRDNDLKQNSIFDLVQKREENMGILELYGEIWNDIEDLKNSEDSDVVRFIKKIKMMFNKDDVSEWIERQKLKKPCNDC